MAFYTSVEFYVIAAVAAAAVVGFCVKPSQKGEARQYLLPGTLIADGSVGEDEIRLEVTEDSKVILTRSGLKGLVHPSGALSIVVNVAGFDITVEERLTPGVPDQDAVGPDCAQFVLDFLGNERYHVKYISEATGRMAAMPINVRPGMMVQRRLM